MSVITAADAAAYLNLKNTDLPLGGALLQSMIDAAEAVIARHCGPLASTTTTVRVRGGSPTLLLPVTPVISLTSITPVGGTALTLAGTYVDSGSGVVSYNSTSAVFPVGFYDVVYNAGRTTVPEDLKMAIQELVRHLWQTQRGPTRRPGSEPSDAASNTIPAAAYLLPFRVSALIGPHIQYGFA